MSVVIYKGHAFAHQPLTQQWKRANYRLGDFLTDADRARAQALTAKEWSLDTILNQGATPHCVGFGWATWGNCLPVDDNYTNSDGHSIYYQAVAIGGYPNSEDGAQTEWGARAMLARERIDNYAWASSLQDIIDWLLVKGPLVTGLMWTVGMADPDTEGLMHATGGDIGGHETCWYSVDKNKGLLGVANSWTTTWANAGRAAMGFDDMAKQLDQQGDCCTCIEKELAPTPTPTPPPPGCLALAQGFAASVKLLKARGASKYQTEIDALNAAIKILQKAK